MNQPLILLSFFFITDKHVDEKYYLGISPADKLEPNPKYTQKHVQSASLNKPGHTHSPPTEFWPPMQCISRAL